MVYFHLNLCSALMKTQPLSFSWYISETDKTFQFDWNNVSVKEHRLSAPLYWKVIPLILTLIMSALCLPTQGDWWLREEIKSRRTTVRWKPKYRFKGRHVHVCHLKSCECVIIFHWQNEWVEIWKNDIHLIYRLANLYLCIANDIHRYTRHNHADPNACGPDLFWSCES